MGLAISPDGNLMAVADLAGQAIYVLSPDSPSSTRKFNVSLPGTRVPLSPTGVAISDSGVVYFTAASGATSGKVNKFFKLNVASGLIAAYPVQTGALKKDIYLRTALSSDNSRVYFNDNGSVFSVDTATDSISAAAMGAPPDDGDNDLALAAGQTRFAASGYFYDSNLNAEAFLGLGPRERSTVQYLYGEKLSPDGTLLFQPTTRGIDVFDARLGKLLKRVALKTPISSLYDSLVSDGADNIPVAITGKNSDGISVIDLSTLPPVQVLPYETRAQERLQSITSRPNLTVHPNVEMVKMVSKSGQKQVPRHNVPHVEVQ
jgi:DNA-binding beta-propeller fold protein YncE